VALGALALVVAGVAIRNLIGLVDMLQIDIEIDFTRLLSFGFLLMADFLDFDYTLFSDDLFSACLAFCSAIAGLKM